MVRFLMSIYSRENDRVCESENIYKCEKTAVSALGYYQWVYEPTASSMNIKFPAKSPFCFVSILSNNLSC